MKWISLALLLVAGVANGTCPAIVPSGKACISWQASTKWTDGTAYSAGTVVIYTVYKIVGTAINPVGTTTSLDLMTPNLPPGNTCFMVTAKVGLAESGASNSACKKIKIPGPTDGKIEGPKDGSIEHK